MHSLARSVRARAWANRDHAAADSGATFVACSQARDLGAGVAQQVAHEREVE